MPTPAKKKVVKLGAQYGPNYDFLNEFGPKGNNMVEFGDTELPHTVIPTGNLVVDLLTPNGGLEAGDWVTLVGDEGVGKTALAYLTMGQGQGMGMLSLYFDTEGRFDTRIARANGLNPYDHDTFFRVRWKPDDPEASTAEKERTMKANLNNFTKLVRAFCSDRRVVARRPDGQYVGGIIVIDSINAAMTLSRESVEVGEGATGFELPKIFSQWQGELLSTIRERNILFISIVQLRGNVQMGQANPNASKTTVPGGHAIRYNSSFTLSMTKTMKEGSGDKVEGQWIRVTATKSTGGRFLVSLSYLLTTDRGPDHDRMILKHGQQFGLVVKRGAWYDLLVPGGAKVPKQGIAKVREFFDADPAMRSIFIDAIRKAALAKPVILGALAPDTSEPGEEVEEEVEVEEADV